MPRLLTASLLALSLTALAAASSPVFGQNGTAAILFDMDSVRHRPTESGEKKTPAGAVELVEGRVGKACKFAFAPDARGGFFTAAVNAAPEWNQAAGISFWVKGDGSASWFGYNDWDSGMRGERFKEVLRLGVERIRRMTKGKSEIVLVTTCPALGRWDTMEELAAAVRTVAAEKKTGLADASAAFH